MPRIVDLSSATISRTTLSSAVEGSAQSSLLYTSSTLDYLRHKYPDKILFTIDDVASELNVSYEFVRLAINSGKIQALNYGKRKMIHFNELTKIISEGIK